MLGRCRQGYASALIRDVGRAVKAAKASGDPNEIKAARAAVQAAKVALGEPGPFWWDTAVQT